MMKSILVKIARRFALLHEKSKSKRYYKYGAWRAKYLKLVLADCGENFQVHGKPLIGEPNKIHIGNHVTINDRVQICPRGEVYIGDYVTMSRGSQITAGTLDLDYWTDERYKEHKHTQSPVHIGEGTWLCVNSIVLPGVTISGKGVIVAAGAVVTHDIREDYCVVGGVPARIVRRLDK